MKKLDKHSVEDILGLAPMQKGMLVHYLKYPESGAYFEQLILNIAGEIDITTFEKAWNFVIQSNEMMRAVFRWEKVENPVQIILKEHKLHFSCYDFSAGETEEIKRQVEELKVKDRMNQFDLRDVPMRVTLCKIGDYKYVAIISNHHILYDGWSNGIILKEFFEAYGDLSGRKRLLRPVKTRFREFVKWNQDRESEKKRGEKYWRNYLQGSDWQTQLPMKKIEDGNHVTCTGNIRTGLGKNIKAQVEDFVKKYRITLASLMYACWGILLQGYCNSEDVIFGTTISGRPIKMAGIQDMVGLFINTLPLRVRTHSREPIIDLIYRIDNVLKIRGEYEHTSLVDIKEYNQLTNSRELFDSIVIIENYPLDSKLMQGNNQLSVESYSIFEGIPYNLAFEITIFDDIRLIFTYNIEMFDEGTIIRLANHFKCITGNIIKDPDTATADIDIIPGEEKKQILYEFNQTDTDYPKDKTIPELFAEQVKKANDKIAVVYEDMHLTYGVLNRKANQFSTGFRNFGIGKDDIVGFMLPRSPDMVIAILGILKAGAICLPLNVKDPERRINTILKDSSTKFLLKQEGPRPFTFMGTVIELNGAEEGPVDPGPGYEEVCSNYLSTSANVGYIIYTSGSTGTPKGVMLTQRGITNHVFSKIKQLEPAEDDIFCFSLSISFVASIWQIFAPLFIGAKLMIYPEDIIIDGYRLLERAVRDNAAVLEVVPSLLNVYLKLLESKKENLDLKGIHKLILTGEKVMTSLVNEFYQRYKVSLINAYGQSECSDDTTHYNIPPDSDTFTVPIGKPLNNTWIYIFGRNKRPQPVNVPGELYIGGDGLSMGYLNRPQLTNEKFVTDPFTASQKLFKTGDLGKWMPDGNIEYLGRVDHQVKVRGNRVDLGEIESHLFSHGGVKKAVVIAVESREETYLCAYYVSTTDFNNNELREYLSQRLPDYMIPAYFIPLVQLPLTSSGKVDRRALPEPYRGGRQEEYIAPRDEMENKMAEIWAEMLAIEKEVIGINSNFFELGGHSLKASIMAAKIHKAFDVELSLVNIFASPTIKELAELIKSTIGKKFETVEPVEKKEYYALSSSQQRLYITNRMKEGDYSHTLTLTLALRGKLERKRLEEAFKKMTKRHESLRTCFDIINGNPMQRIHEDVSFDIEYYAPDVCQLFAGLRLKEDELAADSYTTNSYFLAAKSLGFIRPFDLSQPPLIRAGVIKIEEERYLLMVDIHHIVSDGISCNILVRDFMSLCKGEELPRLRLQYKDFLEWQQGEKENEIFNRQEEYWLKEFSGQVATINLPLDYPRPALKSSEGDSIAFVLNKEKTGALKELAFQEDVTLFIVLLSIFYILLVKICHQEDIVIGTPIAGRKHTDLEQIVGIFINTIALRNQPKVDKSFSAFLAEVKEKTIKGLENQDYPFEDLVDLLKVKRDLSRSPLFDVMFVMQNTEMQPGELVGEKISNLEIQLYRHENYHAHFDILIEAKEKKTSGEIYFKFEYLTKLFKRETIKNFLRFYLRIIDCIVVDRDIKIGEIELLDEEVILEIHRDLLHDMEEIGAEFDI